MCKYKLSVVTINYNNVDGLMDTIKSVVNQTNQDFEYIIIDGGSTDGSVDVIKECADKIDYWISEKDGGIYHAMNKGIMVANGEYCIFMNSGDMFYNKDVIAQVLKRDKLCADIVTGPSYSEVDKEKIWWFPPITIYFSTLYVGTLNHQSSFIKTSLLKEFPYDESLKIVSDWKFFLESLIIANATYKAIEIPISRQDSRGASSDMNILLSERNNVLLDLFPERVLMDYNRVYIKLIFRLQGIFSRFFNYNKFVNYYIRSFFYHRSLKLMDRKD